MEEETKFRIPKGYEPTQMPSLFKDLPGNHDEDLPAMDLP